MAAWISRFPANVPGIAHLPPTTVSSAFQRVGTEPLRPLPLYHGHDNTSVSFSQKYEDLLDKITSAILHRQRFPISKDFEDAREEADPTKTRWEVASRYALHGSPRDRARYITVLITSPWHSQSLMHWRETAMILKGWIDKELAFTGVNILVEIISTHVSGPQYFGPVSIEDVPIADWDAIRETVCSILERHKSTLSTWNCVGLFSLGPDRSRKNNPPTVYIAVNRYSSAQQWQPVIDDILGYLRRTGHNLQLYMEHSDPEELTKFELKEPEKPVRGDDPLLSLEPYEEKVSIGADLSASCYVEVEQRIGPDVDEPGHRPPYQQSVQPVPENPGSSFEMLFRQAMEAEASQERGYSQPFQQPQQPLQGRPTPQTQMPARTQVIPPSGSWRQPGQGPSSSSWRQPGQGSSSGTGRQPGRASSSGSWRQPTQRPSFPSWRQPAPGPAPERHGQAPQETLRAPFSRLQVQEPLLHQRNVHPGQRPPQTPQPQTPQRPPVQRQDATGESFTLLKKTNSSVGTMGCYVEIEHQPGTWKRYILTNHHVVRVILPGFKLSEHNGVYTQITPPEGSKLREADLHGYIFDTSKTKIPFESPSRCKHNKTISWFTERPKIHPYERESSEQMVKKCREFFDSGKQVIGYLYAGSGFTARTSEGGLLDWALIEVLPSRLGNNNLPSRDIWPRTLLDFQPPPLICGKPLKGPVPADRIPDKEKRVFKVSAISKATSGVYLKHRAGIRLDNWKYLVRENLATHTTEACFVSLDTENGPKFAVQGDSGAVVYDENGDAVGLLFRGQRPAGANKFAYVTPLEHVFTHIAKHLKLERSAIRIAKF
ncbi:hypothetical protein NLG97_g8605 [Lecanicillium saksenae]|uniref:Uncharacterized protein n=1 Tax=Lecanicillium saksenae TaxID=468837 RepID=A0ACC1QJ01_9HYPO|nr:hypothetical protein NLG97_g8605 [Lecanicillium saksenae]